MKDSTILKRLSFQLIIISIFFLIGFHQLTAQNTSRNQIIVEYKSIIADDNVNKTEMNQSMGTFVSQLVAELKQRFPCAQVSSRKDLEDKMGKAYGEMAWGKDKESAASLQNVANQVNSAYYVYVNFSFTKFKSSINTKLMNASDGSLLTNNMSDIEDLSGATIKEEIEKICNDVQQSADLCSWIGTITLTKKMARDTTWDEPNSGKDTHRTQQIDTENQVYNFRILSGTRSSCNLEFNKKNVLIQTDKLVNTMCWKPNGDAVFNATSSVECLTENVINGGKDIREASASVENEPESDSFTFHLGIPEQLIPMSYKKKCITESTCISAKEDNQAFSGDGTVNFSDSFTVEGYKKGSATFRGNKSWKDIEGYQVQLEWSLRK